MEAKKLTKIVTGLLILSIFIIAFLMVKPIFISIILALLTSYVLYPVFVRINSIVREKNIATIILIVLVILIILIPVFFLTPRLIKQGFESYSYLQQVNLGDKITGLFSFASSPQVLNSFSVGINNMVAKSFNSLLTELTNIVVNFPNFLLQFTVFIFVFYFATRDLDKLKNFMTSLSPFSQKAEKELSEEFRKITNSIVYGQFLIGLVQGVSLGVGLFVIGVPNVLILTFVAVVTSIIPMFGSWIVWLPASIVLIVSGKLIAGLILILYGALFVSVIDNVLRLMFLSKYTSLNIPMSIIGIVGGLYTFGIVGLILGPLIISYTLVFINLYREGKFNEFFKS